MLYGSVAALHATFSVSYVADSRTQIPESRFPGKFDFVGASHQIMHVAVLAAGLVHYHGLSKALLETRGDMRLAC